MINLITLYQKNGIFTKFVKFIISVSIIATFIIVEVQIEKALNHPSTGELTSDISN